MKYWKHKLNKPSMQSDHRHSPSKLKKNYPIYYIKIYRVKQIFFIFRLGKFFFFQIKMGSAYGLTKYISMKTYLLNRLNFTNPKKKTSKIYCFNAHVHTYN